jgi:hypothetical protein
MYVLTNEYNKLTNEYNLGSLYICMYVHLWTYICMYVWSIYIAFIKYKLVN